MAEVFGLGQKQRRCSMYVLAVPGGCGIMANGVDVSHSNAVVIGMAGCGACLAAESYLRQVKGVSVIRMECEDVGRDLMGRLQGRLGYGTPLVVYGGWATTGYSAVALDELVSRVDEGFGGVKDDG
jgi:hypothetical protein